MGRKLHSLNKKGRNYSKLKLTGLKTGSGIIHSLNKKGRNYSKLKLTDLKTGIAIIHSLEKRRKEEITAG